MDLKQLSKSGLLVALGIITSLSILSFRSRETDDNALLRIKTENQTAPNINYPAKDIKGRSIPRFDYLVVFPDCSSCSDIRSKALTFMESNPNQVFLVLTPDLKNISKFTQRNRYFVSQFSPNTVYAELQSGIYKNEN